MLLLVLSPAFVVGVCVNVEDDGDFVVTVAVEVASVERQRQHNSVSR